jgi:hypothetical protein
VFLNKDKSVMKRFHFIIVIFFLLTNIGFTQRIALHTITNFEVNTTANTFSFDIFSQSIGARSVRVGLTSYYLSFDSSALSSPTLSDINPKYTIGSPTGDYDEMTAQIILGEIAVSILFTGNGDGTGDILLTTGPMGELICKVTLNISNPNTSIDLLWDSTNSAMNTPSFQSVTNIFQGSYSAPTSVEFNFFTGKVIEGTKVELEWPINTARTNSRFEIERSAIENINSEWIKIGFVEGGNRGNEYYSYIDENIWGGKKFKYRLKQIHSDGSYAYSNEVEIELLPTKYELYQNYPNPFNPITKIKFTLPEKSAVSLKVYDILGSVVSEIIKSEFDAGYHKIEFNASNLPSGVYFYRIECSNPAASSPVGQPGQSFVEVKKMLLLK